MRLYLGNPRLDFLQAADAGEPDEKLTVRARSIIVAFCGPLPTLVMRLRSLEYLTGYLDGLRKASSTPALLG
jgi:hypothetical protein